MMAEESILSVGFNASQRETIKFLVNKANLTRTPKTDKYILDSILESISKEEMKISNFECDICKKIHAGLDKSPDRETICIYCYADGNWTGNYVNHNE